MDISFLVSCDGGRDLGTYKLENADQKTIEQYSQELLSASKRIRTNKDLDHKRRNNSFLHFPTLYFIDIELA